MKFVFSSIFEIFKKSPWIIINSLFSFYNQKLGFKTDFVGSRFSKGSLKHFTTCTIS